MYFKTVDVPYEQTKYEALLNNITKDFCVSMAVNIAILNP